MAKREIDVAHSHSPISLAGLVLGKTISKTNNPTLEMWIDDKNPMLLEYSLKDTQGAIVITSLSNFVYKKTE